MLGNFLKRSDLFLLKRFQWCSDKIFDLVGIGNFQIAKLLMGVYCGLLVWDYSISTSLLKLVNDNTSTGQLLFKLIPLIVLFLWWKHVIDIAEKTTNETREGFLSQNVFSFMFLRILKIFFLMLGLINLSTAISILSDGTWPLPKHYQGLYKLCDYLEEFVSSIVLYFACCQPKPHQTSKLKAFIAKITMTRKPAFSN